MEAVGLKGVRSVAQCDAEEHGGKHGHSDPHPIIFLIAQCTVEQGNTEA